MQPAPLDPRERPEQRAQPGPLARLERPEQRAPLGRLVQREQLGHREQLDPWEPRLHAGGHNQNGVP